jgi:MFS family permease
MSKTETSKDFRRRQFGMVYTILLIVILGLAHSLDEYSSLASSQIKTFILLEFFGSATSESGQMVLQLLGIVGIFLMLGSTVIKGLQDKYGRRKIFIISTMGMTLGVLIICLVPYENLAIYFLGTTIANLFLFNDMQYVYINEEMSSNKRAQAFTTAKIIGIGAILMLPVVRGLTGLGVITNDWRPIYYLPLIIGIIVLILSIAFLKEPHAYTVYLEDKKNNPEKYKEEKVSIKETYQALKNSKNWDQIKWITIVMVIAVPMAGINVAHNELFMFQATGDAALVTTLLFISNLSVGLIYLIQGQVADRIGRRFSYIMNTALVIILLPLEFVIFMWVPSLWWLAAVFQGIRVGAVWNITDVNRFLFIENVPTKIRGMSQVVWGLAVFIAVPVSLILGIVLVAIFAELVHLILLVQGLPLMIISLYFIVKHIKETVHVDITKIEFEE